MICHCSQCRRATGSAFKPFGGIERAKLEVTQGTIRIFGDVMTHDAHCKNCGSLLYSIVQEGTRAHVTSSLPTSIPIDWISQKKWGQLSLSTCEPKICRTR